MGNLTGSFSTFTGNGSTEIFDLSSPVKADWIQFPQSATSPNRRLGGGSTISLPTVVGTNSPTLAGFNGSYGLTWSDGTPTTSATASEDGIWVSAGVPTIGQGYSFTLPADQDTRTVDIYWGGNSGAIKLVAHLSDGSATDYTETHASGGSGVATYFRSTLVYTANSASKTLTVTCTITSLTGGAGNTWLMAAAYTTRINPRGTMAQTLANATMAASGAMAGGASGTMGVTLGNGVMSAAGGETISGTMAQTLGAATSATAALETFSGQTSPLLDSFQMAATGGETFSGTMAQTLAAATMTSGGGLPVSGTMTPTLQNATGNASGAEIFSGPLAPTLANAAMAASGGLAISGSMASTLASITPAMPTQEIFSGPLVRTLDDVTPAVSAQQIFSATLARTLDALVFTGVGNAYVPGGTMAVTLDNFVLGVQGQNLEPSNVFEMGYWIVGHRRQHEL